MWQFRTRKICPKALKIIKVGLKICPLLNKPQKITQIIQNGKILPNLVTLNAIRLKLVKCFIGCIGSASNNITIGQDHFNSAELSDWSKYGQSS